MVDVGDDQTERVVDRPRVHDGASVKETDAVPQGVLADQAWTPSPSFENGTGRATANVRGGLAAAVGSVLGAADRTREVNVS